MFLQRQHDRAKRRRRGATMTETVITLLVFFTLIFGMLDLGIAVFQRQLLSQAARQIGRTTIVHGELADQLGPWGPDTISGTAAENADADPADPGQQIAEICRSTLVGIDPNEVTYEVTWIDGGNDPMVGHRVNVSVSAPYQPIMTFIFGNPTFMLTGESTMRIAH